MLFIFVAQRTESRFLIIFLLLCICSFLFIPPFSTPDFAPQFLRAYEIASGQLVTVVVDDNANALLPANLIPANLASYGDLSVGPNYHLLDELFSTTIDPQNLAYYSYAAQAVYSPLSFLPAAFGIKVASLFTTNLGVIIYAMRLVSMTAVALLLYFSIKLMPAPRDKTIFAIFSLFPMFLETCPSASADGLTYALIALFFAYVTCLKSTKKRANYIGLGFLVLALALIKIVYLPICLLAIMIPQESFGSKKSKIIVLSILAALSLTANLVWLDVASQFLFFIPGVNPTDQINNILGNPFAFIFILMDTITKCSGDWISYLFGFGLNCYGIQPDRFLSLILLCLFVAFIARHYQPSSPSYTTHERLFIYGIVCLIIFLTFLSLYLQWNVVGSQMINGFQGRYLQPLCPLVFSTLCTPNATAGKKYWLAWFAVLCLIFIYPLAAAL